jgi:hypothetical protein
MKTFYKQISIPMLFLSIFVSLSSCNKQQVSLEPKKPVPLNTFAVEVNGRAWLPEQIGKDECMRTYYGAWSSLDYPFFNLVAYRDPQGLTGAGSENALNIQIMNVRGLGKYELTGSYLESFKSYAFFTMKKPDGSRVRYINRRDVSSFSVVFEAFIPLEKTNIQGVKGVFAGTLYNEVDPLDSIKLTHGDFTFNRPNRYSFNQCD